MRNYEIEKRLRNIIDNNKEIDVRKLIETFFDEEKERISEIVDD